MNQAQAEALVAGQKILYWDGRIATVTIVATMPPLPPPEINVGILTPVVSIVFDADPNPKPVYQINSNDFMRAEVYSP